MALADGDVAEYQLMNRMSLQDFLLKFAKFTNDVSEQRKAAEAAKKKRR
jgi:hypothetical protein